MPGGTATPLTLVHVLELHARHRGGHVAVEDDHGPATYRDLWEASTLVAARLRHLGAGPGSTVALALAPGAPYVAAWLGALRAGAVAAPLNTRLAPPEVEAYLAVLEPTASVVDPATDPAVPTAGAHLVLEEAPPGATLAERVGGPPADPSLDLPLPAVEEAAPAVAFATGGTTGTPKAALWSHRSLALATASACAHLEVTRSDRELYLSPFFHVAAVTGFLATLHAGGTSRVLPRPDAEAAAHLLLHEGATRLFATPTVYERLLQHLGPDPRPEVGAKLVFGAARSDSSFVERLRATFPNARLFSGYGATEFGAVVRLFPEDVASGQDRGVGRPVSGVRLTLVDPTGTEVGPGQQGEIAVASPWQMMGYRGPETARLLADGSILSGDLGTIDGEGYLHLVGRAKETIKTGGENVYPMEVERVLLAHPSVADAALVGVPDPIWGERVEAAVVLHPGAALDPEGLREHCRASLAGYKVPKRFVALDDLPYTPNMKLDRRRLAGSWTVAPQPVDPI